MSRARQQEIEPPAALEDAEARRVNFDVFESAGIVCIASAILRVLKRSGR
jgi:hypothetical protein